MAVEHQSESSFQRDESDAVQISSRDLFELNVLKARRQFPGLRRKGILMLLHLLDNAGSFVHRDELARVLELRTYRSVRVYICNIRREIEALGITDGIQTGNASYAIQPDAAEEIRVHIGAIEGRSLI